MQSLFDIPERSNKTADSALIKKSTTKKSAPVATKSSGGSIASRVTTIKAAVAKALGKYADEYEIINTKERLQEYIDHVVSNGVVAIDTETTGLDPLQDDIVGISMYTPGEKSVYIPINHVSYVTGLPAKNQMKIDDFFREQFERLLNVYIIMFNAPFDIRVIWHHVGVRLHCNWDCYLGARCLNDNEPSNKLKKLHQKYVLRGEEDAFSFDELFKGLNFAYVPISTAYIYAAHDAIITFEYYEYQKKYLRLDHERPDMRDIAWVFFNIEMPCIDAVVDLEDTGIELDMEYNNKLKEKYHKILDEKKAEFEKVCSMYSDEIDNYRGKIRLDNPISIDSTQQLAALLYDIAKIPQQIDKKTKKPTRSTSEEVLKALKHPLADAILAYRAYSTIVSTFIDKLPECVNPKDGRIHCKFNQYGADTGRFSSSDPNMQNIPSHNKDIRKMFKATDGYVILSADYSQQEIKGMAQMCGDDGMIEAFRQGKDFYAEIASVAFGYPYEECLEFRPDGTTNPAGKERRAQAKSILLGINYGRGAASIAEQIGCTKKEAERIKDDVFNGFPAIAEFERQSFEMAESLGYVTTLWGRKRRFPAMMLPDYEFDWTDSHKSGEDDPLSFGEELDEEIPDSVVNKYVNKLNRAWKKEDKLKIINDAKHEGIQIVDNRGKKDYTKIVNARIQGTAADMTKLAMIELNKNERLKELGFRMLVPIHDEILAECPVEDVAEVVPLFAKIMSEAPGERFVVPISCDVEIAYRWYGEKYTIKDGELVKLEG